MPGSSASMLLMIVDDDPDIRSILTIILEQKYPSRTVVGAKNGAECLDILARTRFADPSIILTDFSMPVMNGIELKREIKRIYPSIKIILFTALPKMNDNGFDDVLFKPINIDELIDCINKFGGKIA